MSDVARLLEDRAVRRVLTLLHADGEEARVVGGAVRNALLGRPITDVDVATTARPEVVVARAAAAGFRTLPTGIAHGTVTVLLAGRRIEVTTLREDVETDGRHAVIRFGRDFGADALRRDFTINALSMGPDGEVHDYAGGLADIAAARVRFIGDPATRIREDYLRILRFFRFSADYSAGPLDAAGLDAAVRERAGLDRLSRERVQQELMKLLVTRRAAEVVGIVADCGLLGPILRSVLQPARLARLLAIDPTAGAVLRLTALAAVVREDGARLREAIKLSNSDTRRIEMAADARSRLHGLERAPLPDRIKALLFDLGRRATGDGVRLAWAESGASTSDPDWRAALQRAEETPEPRFPFSGGDLVARGVPAGPALGHVLKRLREAWIRAGFPEGEQALSALLDAALSSRAGLEGTGRELPA